MQKEKGKSSTQGRVRTAGTFALCLFTFAFLAGCTREGKFQPVSMWNESRIKAYEESPEAGVRSSARVPPPGTVARGSLAPTDPILTGRSGGALVTRSPIPVTPELLQRGQERYNVYCSPCHGLTGDGNGMIVKRGFPHPPDYALPRLRQAALGHYYDVITNGYGVMYSYAERIPPTDRWAISAYIRVLQRSRPVVTQDRYEQEREKARLEGIQDPARGMRVPTGQPGIVNPTDQPSTFDHGGQDGGETKPSSPGH